MAEAVYRTRPMTRDELDWTLDLTDSEGWNPGLHDAECFFEEDPGAFVMATADEVPAGCISAVNYDDGFSFAGLFIVEQRWRGRGVAARLVDAALERVGGRTVGQDAVSAMRQRYESMGFTVAFTSSRFEGVARQDLSPGTSLLDVSAVDFAALAEFDGLCFPTRRDRFLARWVHMPESSCTVSVREGEVTGYGVMRRCRVGYKVGPLFATDAPTAGALFDSLAGRVEGEPVYLDVPAPNAPGTELATSRGMRVVFETHRMYLGDAPSLPLEMIFGISSFEFG